MAKYTDTLTGDGDSSVYRVTEAQDTGRQPTPAALRSNAEVVGFSLSGTWSGVVATLKVCMDETASPQVFTAVPGGAYTVDVGDSWNIPYGALFKVTVSGSGSPVPALAFTVRGDITQL